MLKRIAAAQPHLLWTGIFLLALMLPTGVGLWLDGRTLNGINVWIKPLKFQLSAGVYLLTLALCFLALRPGADQTRAGRYVMWGAVITAIFEVAYITAQAARGEASHWNFSSAFTIAMYSAMGLGAVILASTSAVLGVMIHQDRTVALGGVLRTGLVMGLLLTFILGTAFGAWMSARTGHWVGGTLNDAGGLPLFKWSRDGGDLRVAHFFGLHAVHFIVPFAWAAQRVLREAAARPALWGFTALYCALTLGTFVQALLGRPFVGA
jgi:hypothetical protein